MTLWLVAVKHVRGHTGEKKRRMKQRQGIIRHPPLSRDARASASVSQAVKPLCLVLVDRRIRCSSRCGYCRLIRHVLLKEKEIRDGIWFIMLRN